MTIYKCKSFIRANTSSALIYRLPIVQSPFTYFEKTLIRQYISGDILGTFWLSQQYWPFQHYWVTTNMAASEFVELIIYARPGSSLIYIDSNPQKQTMDREILGQNRLDYCYGLYWCEVWFYINTKRFLQSIDIKRNKRQKSEVLVSPMVVSNHGFKR